MLDALEATCTLQENGTTGYHFNLLRCSTNSPIHQSIVVRQIASSNNTGTTHIHQNLTKNIEICRMQNATKLYSYIVLVNRKSSVKKKRKSDEKPREITEISAHAFTEGVYNMTPDHSKDHWFEHEHKQHVPVQCIPDVCVKGSFNLPSLIKQKEEPKI